MSGIHQQVDFYLLNNSVEQGRLKLTTRLCQKILKTGSSALIYLDDMDDCHGLDDLLWSYQASSFIPHATTTKASTISAKKYPIMLHHGLHKVEDVMQFDVLINLTANADDSFLAFPRIVEIVDNDSDAKVLARKRYKFYQSQSSLMQSDKSLNLTLKTHDIMI